MSETSSKMRRWYNPAIGVAELAFGIIGVALAIYLHLSSQKVRQLEFSVSPDRALVVKSGFSELHVLYNNREIKEDVTAEPSGTEVVNQLGLTMSLAPYKLLPSRRSKFCQRAPVV
jgi:hypothetical protein